MRTRYLAILLIPILLTGCAVTMDVESMLQDFDNYEQNLKAVATDELALETLKEGARKRAEAGALFDEGKKKDAAPLAEQAVADARLALEMDKMKASASRAERCKLEVEQARTKWREAVFVLEQTEKFVGTRALNSGKVPEVEQDQEQDMPSLPKSTLLPDSFPPATFADVSAQWAPWRRAAGERNVVAADLDNAYRRSLAATQVPRVREITIDHQRYLAARVVQSLECRVHAQASERACLESAELTAGYGDARADALRATLDLERGLQDNLRTELDHLRAEAKTRQDELYNALSQMEGKFASIRRDARGTIVSLADILFEFDKATLQRTVEFNLVKIATILNQFEEMGILIEGHTDSIGTDEYNLGLSQRRAKAVFEFLLSQGVTETRMSWEGYGESRPVADNDTDEGRQRNRRVDLVIQDAP